MNRIIFPKIGALFPLFKKAGVTSSLHLASCNLEVIIVMLVIQLGEREKWSRYEFSRKNMSRRICEKIHL